MIVQVGGYEARGRGVDLDRRAFQLEGVVQGRRIERRLGGVVAEQQGSKASLLGRRGVFGATSVRIKPRATSSDERRELSTMEPVPAQDGEPMPLRSDGQEWVVSWHPPHPPHVEPAGSGHGAAGVCVTTEHQLVLISHDGMHWGFPAGRPDGDEQIEETLRREMLEEACAVVGDAQLLGFARSVCVAGREAGLVLVRSYWRAAVELQPWEPQFEVGHRRVVPAADAKAHVRDPDETATRISFRALAEAGLG